MTERGAQAQLLIMELKLVIESMWGVFMVIKLVKKTFIKPSQNSYVTQKLLSKIVNKIQSESIQSEKVNIKIKILAVLLMLKLLIVNKI